MENGNIEANSKYEYINCNINNIKHCFWIKTYFKNNNTKIFLIKVK